MNGSLQIETQHIFEGKERNLFLVSTALQLLNAIEAQNHFKTKNDTLVLLYYGNQNNDHVQIQNLVNLFSYSKLIIFNVGNQKKYHNLIVKLIKELKKENYYKVFTGFFSANLRRFIVNTTYKDLFLLDDGVYTLAIHNELYNPDTKGYKKYITKYSEKKRSTIVKQLRFTLYHLYRKFYLRLHHCKNDMKTIDLKFFTLFNLKPFSNEIIIENNYAFLKDYYQISYEALKINNKTIYFLGQPLKRVFAIENSEYLAYLKFIFTFYSKNNFNIIYIPHRSEEKEILHLIQTMQFNNVKIQELSQPFELYLLEHKVPITHIASFISSALFSVKKLYPNLKVSAFKFSTNEDIEKNTSLIYSMLEQNDTTIFQITNKGLQ